MSVQIYTGVLPTVALHKQSGQFSLFGLDEIVINPFCPFPPKKLLDKIRAMRINRGIMKYPMRRVKVRGRRIGLKRQRNCYPLGD
jgi:hypothetical protein